MNKILAFAVIVVLSTLFGADAFVNSAGRPEFVITKSAAPLKMTLLTYGNKKKDFKPGTPLKTAVAQLGVKPKYSCNK
jgi:hypothetical protein